MAGDKIAPTGRILVRLITRVGDVRFGSLATERFRAIPANVRCYSNSDNIADMPRMTLSANSDVPVSLKCGASSKNFSRGLTEVPKVSCRIS
jgi:hypothetical protein